MTTPEDTGVVAPKKKKPRKRHVTKTHIRKLCTHKGECACAWHYALQHKKTHHRFSLNRADLEQYRPKNRQGKTIATKKEAVELAEEITLAIEKGSFGVVVPAVPAKVVHTVATLLGTYEARYVARKRPTSASRVASQVQVICRMPMERPDGLSVPLGQWLVADVSADTLERFQEARAATPVAANRDLALLRAAWRWSVRKGIVKGTPFRIETEPSIKLTHEPARDRRLDDDEATALLAACGPHLRVLVEAALETACRAGELTSLQWHQVRGLRIDEDGTMTWDAHAYIFLPAKKTKTKKDRIIPISPRLRAFLEMRRCDPRGTPMEATCYVFGTSLGTRIVSVTRAWHAAVLKSHGHTPEYVGTNLSPASRKALAEVDLHLHDLRREAASRWLEGGIALHDIQALLGHSKLTQTASYLNTTKARTLDTMTRYFERNDLARTPASSVTIDPQKGQRTHAATVTTEEKTQ